MKSVICEHINFMLSGSDCVKKGVLIQEEHLENFYQR